jgi:hypothetical protein
MPWNLLQPSGMNYMNYLYCNLEILPVSFRTKNALAATNILDFENSNFTHDLLTAHNYVQTTETLHDSERNKVRNRRR